ncbi:MAG: RluA family pseudouridine synthase [Planctomycetota bacterium]|nr:MAG: RluA family pseudouridine synthase [Planctomycetota bacterium]
MPDARVQDFVIPEEHDGERLDRALSALVDGWSRERLRRLIEEGQVRVDGQLATRPSETVHTGARIAVALELAEHVRPGARAGLDFRVLYEDEDVIAIDKPAGMVAHPSTTVRGGTVSELATARFGALPAAQGADRPGIVHRLDSETSGVMVLARSDAAAASLVEQFRERRVRKVYHGIVQGEARFDTDWIEFSLARSAENEGRVQIARDGDGKPASTFYRTLERFDGAAFLELEPKTGRTHQLRAHLEAIDMPLFGDPLYRGRRRTSLAREAPIPARQALHASRLELSHPRTGAALAFDAPLPADLVALLDWLRLHRAL